MIKLRRTISETPLPLRQRFLLATACLIAGVALGPRCICERGADAYFDRDLATQDLLAKDVASSISNHSGLHYYHTKMSRFDGQSAIAIYQMAILGLGQIVIDHPEKRSEYLPAMREAADRMVDPATLGYAAKLYGANGVEAMAPKAGHAYLGYINLALGMLRQVDPETKHAALNDRLTEALAERLFAAPNGMIETYPGETWPPDVAAVAGSIGLHSRVTGKNRQPQINEWAKRFSSCAIDSSGYLVQRVKSGGCKPMDAPRGSGTAIGSYFISFVHPELSKRLYEALSDGTRTLWGFGAVREYSSGHHGDGDTNSGFVIAGMSVGATGFGIGAAKANGDRALFKELYRTSYLFGMPSQVGDKQKYAVGGVLGNALLLAMLTARQP